MTDNSTAYEIRALVLERSGHRIIDGVDLDVRYGEVLGLVGPNGAGKSTLLAGMSGELEATAGKVELAGKPIESWTSRQLARRRAVLLQDNQVSFAFRVREVVEMGRSPWASKSTIDDDERIVTEAMQVTDVERFADRRFQQLSGGEKARTSLARVLAQDTPVVLLDEPTAALDLRHQEEVMRVARALADRGRAVVVVLHDLSLAAAWSDQIAVISDGKLAAVGPPAEVLTAERIAAVYGIDVHVLTDPSDRLVIVPRRDA